MLWNFRGQAAQLEGLTFAKNCIDEIAKHTTDEAIKSIYEERFGSIETEQFIPSDADHPNGYNLIGLSELRQEAGKNWES